MSLNDLFSSLKTGRGRGHHGHAGRPGHRGGSVSSGYRDAEGNRVLVTSKADLSSVLNSLADKKRVAFIYNSKTGNTHINSGLDYSHAYFEVRSMEDHRFDAEYVSEEVIVKGYVYPKDNKMTYYAHDYSDRPRGVSKRVERALDKFLKVPFSFNGQELEKSMGDT